MLAKGRLPTGSAAGSLRLDLPVAAGNGCQMDDADHPAADLAIRSGSLMLKLCQLNHPPGIAAASVAGLPLVSTIVQAMRKRVDLAAD